MAVKKIGAAVDSLFDRAKTRFLGQRHAPSQIRLRWSPRYTLEGVFKEASMQEHVRPNESILKVLMETAEGFLDAQRQQTKTRVVKAVQSFLAQAHTSGVDTDLETVLGGELADVWRQASEGVERIVSTESNSAKNTGILDGIIKINTANDIDDPVVYFVVVNDEKLCKECRRLHLNNDGTPRLWRLSQLGHGYHKRGQETPKLSGLHPNCFTGDMRLHSDEGLLTIKELFDKGSLINAVVDLRVKNRRVGNNQFGEEISGEVWFHRHTSGARVLPASAVYETGVQECIRITLENETFLDVSVGHEMWVDDDSRGHKVRADELRVGDKIPLLSGEGRFGSEHFPELAELMGNLMGDGNINSSIAAWNFFGDDIEYGERLKRFGARFSKRLSGEMTVRLPGAKYNVSQASFSSSVLRRIFVDEFGLSKTPRRVPRRIWGASKETVSAFLRGLYAADGHSEATPSVVLAQNDFEFLREIQLLLSNFGIRSGIFNHGEAGEKKIIYANGSSFDTSRKRCWRLVIGGWSQVEKFSREIGMGVPEKQRKLLFRLENKENESRLGAWRTARVKKIEQIGEMQTYCLTEPMTNTVSVNGIVTGNCRCTLVTLLPGYGFDKQGQIEFKHLDYDAMAEQQKKAA